MSDAEHFLLYAQDNASLRALPYAEASEAGDAINTLADELTRRTPLDVLRWESNLSDPYFRVLALDYLRQQARAESAPTVWEGRTLDEQVLIEGDLVVKGNLENASNLVVLGDLVVEGAYIALGEYPCCSVAGSMSATNFYANEAETICLGMLSVEASLVVIYNHTVTIARKVVADTLIADDAAIDGEIEAKHHYEDPSYSVYRERFGIEFDEDDDDFDPGEHIHEGVIASMLETATSR